MRLCNIGSILGNKVLVQRMLYYVNLQEDVAANFSTNSIEKLPFTCKSTGQVKIIMQRPSDNQALTKLFLGAAWYCLQYLLLFINERTALTEL